ncbi:hypothetical protein [Flavobacterium sp. 7A]|uniref:hypothetical protein n=1 Tax=Flavobacterium sp. 7A TaxID=2940571 RepID=UPI0022276E2A|nr:hypothetical protein [Flavobacterium sp. 7A]MCW2119022.1 hypothetical protein [Flavobacterium sp. 7A]
MGALFLLLIVTLFFDSNYMANKIISTQHIATAVMLVAFAIIFFKATLRIRKLMLYAVIIGIVGEHLFSIGLNMYTYRLKNVPLYVPPGHAIVYITAVYFCKEPIVRKYRKSLEKYFTIFILIYSTLFLLLTQDIFGFIMSILVLVLLRKHPRERLFFYSMYIIVAFLEIIGTNYGCWSWPPTAYDFFPFLKSANPPSGISLFYFTLDLGCLLFYKYQNIKAWKRMKHIRLLNKEVI